jgi:hypothetical protein
LALIPLPRTLAADAASSDILRLLCKAAAQVRPEIALVANGGKAKRDSPYFMRKPGIVYIDASSI